jgi:deoxyhypusine synthase
MKTNSISQFIDHHYRHFNTATLKDAADSEERHARKLFPSFGQNPAMR